MFTTSAIACVTLDADGKGEFLWQKAPATSRWPTPSDGPRPAVTAAPAVADLNQYQQCGVTAVLFWCPVKRHNMRMLRQPQRGLLFEDVFPVPVHHAGAKHMLAAAGGN